jgi:hypothetical protein
LNRGKTGESALKLVQGVNQDLTYFNELAPRYFESRWNDKCELLSNWPADVLAQCEQESDQSGFGDMELTYCPCYNKEKGHVMMLNEGKKGVDEDDYELVEYKKGKAFQRKNKKSAPTTKLEVGSCYNF